MFAGIGLPLVAAAAVLTPFVISLVIVVSPQAYAKWLCIAAGAVSTALTVAVWAGCKRRPGNVRRAGVVRRCGTAGHDA